MYTGRYCAYTYTYACTDGTAIIHNRICILYLRRDRAGRVRFIRRYEKEMRRGRFSATWRVTAAAKFTFSRDDKSKERCLLRLNTTIIYTSARETLVVSDFPAV